MLLLKLCYLGAHKFARATNRRSFGQIGAMPRRCLACPCRLHAWMTCLSVAASRGDIPHHHQSHWSSRACLQPWPPQSHRMLLGFQMIRVREGERLHLHYYQHWDCSLATQLWRFRPFHPFHCERTSSRRLASTFYCFHCWIFWLSWQRDAESKRLFDSSSFVIARADSLPFFFYSNLFS